MRVLLHYEQLTS